MVDIKDDSQIWSTGFLTKKKRKKEKNGIGSEWK